MSEIVVEVSVDELYKQIGQLHVAIAHLRSQNQSLTELVQQLRDHLAELEGVQVDAPGS